MTTSRCSHTSFPKDPSQILEGPLDPSMSPPPLKEIDPCRSDMDSPKYAKCLFSLNVDGEGLQYLLHSPDRKWSPSIGEGGGWNFTPSPHRQEIVSSRDITVHMANTSARVLMHIRLTDVAGSLSYESLTLSGVGTIFSLGGLT